MTRAPSIAAETPAWPGGAPVYTAWAVGALVVVALDAVLGAGWRMASWGFLLAAGAPLLLQSVTPGFARDELARAVVFAAWTGAAGSACLLAGPTSGAFAAWFITPAIVAAVSGPSRSVAEGAVAGLTGLVGVWALAALGLAPPPPAPSQLGLLPLGAVAMAIVFAGAAAARLHERSVRRIAARERRLARLAALIDHAPVRLLRVQASGRVMEARGRMGRDADASVPATLADVFDHVDGALARDATTQAVTRREARVFEAIVDGAPTEVRVSPYGVGEAVFVLRDISSDLERLTRVEAERDAAAARAQASAQFVASMSHELRTPLNAILGFSEMMRANVFGPLTPKYEEYAGLIHESGAHLLDLVGDLLDLSKTEAGRYQLSRSVFDARQAVSAATRLTADLARARGVHLSVQAGAAAIEVDADFRVLKQILLNLLSNAIKFTPEGGCVTVRAAARGPELVLEVADTGPGMSPDELERVGRPYHQSAAGRASAARGTGLGLALVQAFAELHGGALEAESVLGAGSTMRVRAPVVVRPPRGAASAPARASGAV